MADILHYDPFSVGQSAVPDINGIINQNRLFALRQQEQNYNTGHLALAQQEQTQKLQRQQQLQAAVEAYWQNPSADALSKLMMDFPEAADALKSGGAVSDAEKQRQQFSQATGLFFKAQQDPEAAATDLDTMTAADQAAGLPDDGTHSAIAAMLRSKDQGQIDRARGLIFMNAYRNAGDQKGFLDAAKEYFPGASAKDPIHWWNGLAFKTGPDGNPVIVGQSPGRTITTQTGQVVALPDIPGVPMIPINGTATVPAAPAAGTNPNPATPGSAVKRTGGWTPLGGANSRNVLDNKLGVMSRQSGIGIDQPLHAADIPRVFDALAKTEGGIGVRANNPGNIKDGPFAKSQPGYIGSMKGYAQFDTPEHGRAAGIALMSNKLAAGHSTMRDIVEGRPATSTGPQAQAHKEMNGKHYVKMNGQWFEAS